VEEHTEPFIDNIRSVTISPKTADQIQHGQEIGHVEPKRGTVRKPSSSKVTAVAVNEDAWAVARRRAEEIATDALGYSNTTTIPKGAQKKIQSLTNSLIVVQDDGGVMVYNNTEQVREVKRQARRAKKSQD
jgi:hypothetical protein